MTTKQIKVKITQVLDEVPESALTEVWNYLNIARGKSDEEIRRAQSLSRVLEEDRALLEKLAR